MVRLPFDESLNDRRLNFNFNSDDSRRIGLLVDGNVISQLCGLSGKELVVITYDMCWRVWSDVITKPDTFINHCHQGQIINDSNLARIIAMMIINERSKGDEIELALRALGYSFSGYKLIRNHLTGGYVVQRKAQDVSELASYEDFLKAMSPRSAITAD